VTPANVPGVHGKQLTVRRPVENMPNGQAAHAGHPVSLAYRPGVHSLHVGAAGVATAVPNGQLMHDGASGGEKRPG
jgi:hypothetical protein